MRNTRQTGRDSSTGSNDRNGPSGRRDNDDPGRRREDADVVVGAARPIDGTGTNAENPEFGAVDQTLLRLADANFDDGIGDLADDGLPNPREISNTVSAQEGDEPNELGASSFLFAWGQFIDHDIDLTPEGSTEDASIVVPDGDPVFADGSTIHFSRVDPIDGTGETTPREYPNVITGFLDASMVYGSDEETAQSLRGDGGRLLIGEDGLLPEAPGGVLAGDVRAAENVALTSLHTLFVREHNYWIDELAKKDSSLTDDELYTGARNCVEAEIQAITYNEFLPILVGEDAIAEYSGYDPTVDPGISVEFSTAVYRFGHSLLTSNLQRLEENGDTIAAGDLALADAFFVPDELVNGGIEAILRGLGDSTSQEVDTHIVEDVRSFLFAGPDGPGLDLAAINIQRGRDLGVATYNDLREALGLERAETFADVTTNSELAAQLETLYGDVDLIDAWIGGLAEDHVNGGLLGELFSTVMVDQFTRLRDGDAFWSEGSDLPPNEIDALWSTTLSDIIERNTDVDVIQDNAFFAYDRIGGDDGDNVLEGSDGRDLLIGARGDDALSGNDNEDQLAGEGGNDVLAGGSGDDVLEGGKDMDTFVFLSGEAGNDTIQDFGKTDVVDLTDFDLINTFEDLEFSSDDSGTTLILEENQTVTFDGLGIDDFRADDFLLNA